MHLGYKAFRIEGKFKFEHVLIAEKALGRTLPKEVQVHHFDYNKQNNSRRNLVICPNAAYHKLLHVRTDALNATGNPNARKCSRCKQYDLLENLKVYEGKRTIIVHPACARKYQKLAERRIGTN